MPSKDEHAALIGLPDRGRRVVSLSKHSTVDSLIYGRDLDQSGDNPHRDFMHKLVKDGYAGEPSGHRDAKAANKKLRAVLNMSSQMSSHVDEQSPHEEFMTKFADRAGHRTVETRFKPMRKPGLRHTQSMFDIMGRPGVARTPRGISVQEVTAAGGKTEPELQRQEGRSCVIATKWTRSTLRIGESEHPGALSEDLPDERFDGHAGKARKPESVSTTAKHGASLKSISVVDKLLYGRDLSKATTDPGLEYAERFAGYAGYVYKMPKKKAPSPQEGEVKECVAEVADPILPGHPQDAQDAQDACNFSPLSPTSISLADPPAPGDAQPLTATPQIAQSPPETPTSQIRASPFNVKRASFSSSSSRASSVSGVSSRHSRPRWQ